MLAVAPGYTPAPFQSSRVQIWTAEPQPQQQPGMQTPNRGAAREPPRPQRLQQSSQQPQSSQPQIYQRQSATQLTPQKQQACLQQLRQSQQQQLGDQAAQQQQQPRPRRQSQPHLTLPQLDEDEQELLRQLEDDIASQPVAAPGGSPTAAPPAAPPRPWRNRVMAVAAMKAEPDQRRRLEEDILAVAASSCSETATAALGALGPGQYRRLTQAEPGASTARAAGVGPADSKSRSAPGSMMVRDSVLTAEDEDYLDLIMMGGKPAPGAK